MGALVASQRSRASGHRSHHGSPWRTRSFSVRPSCRATLANTRSGLCGERSVTVLRLMKIASEWSDSISVRGDYSAEVLAHYGIDNVTITGCPPLLANLDASHRVAKPQRQVTRVALKRSGGRPEERLFRRCWRGRAPRLRSSATSADQPPERASPETCLAAGLDFVAQAGLPGVYLCLGQTERRCFRSGVSRLFVPGLWHH